jgi:sterol desaturase/sphingolipid hydroxylase (fatty acid hydroxylase superfamily)
MTRFDAIMVSRANYVAGIVFDCVGSLAAIVTGFVLGARLGPALVAIAAAALWYTLVEYAIHRWLYHAGDSVMAVVHDWHHAEPTVMLGAPFYCSVSLWGLHGLAAGVLLGAPLGLVFGGTLLFSYGQQTLIHHAAHRYPRLDVLGARSALRRHHAVHHIVGDANFGVSTTLWDRVLGTYVTTSARRPRATPRARRRRPGSCMYPVKGRAMQRGAPP